MADQAGPAGVPDFGKTENRNQGRLWGRAGGVVVGAGLRGGERVLENAEKRLFLRKGAGSLAVAGLFLVFGVNLA